jgi:hypothetical protein
LGIRRIKLAVYQGSKMEEQSLKGPDLSMGGIDLSFEVYEPKDPNDNLRWNYLYLFLVMLLCPLAAYLAFWDAAMAFQVSMGLQALVQLSFLVACLYCWRYMWTMIGAVNEDWLAKATQLDDDMVLRIRHVVVMTAYAEPLELICRSIRSLAAQTMANKIIMAVAFEASTPSLQEKSAAIQTEFSNSFLSLEITVHELLPSEIRGKCSNINYGMRSVVKNNLVQNVIDPKYTTCTSCDCDTTFHYRYFENLTYNFITNADRYNVVWQSPLFYNLSLDQRFFFTRVTGILRSFFIIGLLVPFSINTTSVYSTSLLMMRNGCFFHPGYQSDDIIYTLSAMRAIKKRVRIHYIEVPTISGPTSGSNLWDEFVEWRIQAKRWTIGAAEVFHYYFIKFIRCRFSFVAGLTYGLSFTYYYCFILCIVQINWLVNCIVFGIPSVAEELQDHTWGDFHIGQYLSYFTAGGLIFQYLTTYLTAYFMDSLVCKVLVIREQISWLRCLGHFLSTPFVLLAYNFVEFAAIWELAIRGKAVCGHRASKKDNLA